MVRSESKISVDTSIERLGGGKNGDGKHVQISRRLRDKHIGQYVCSISII